METALMIGFGYLLLGAICGGSFGLPSKYVQKDTPWEVLWGPFFFFVTILLPIALGPVIMNDFFSVFKSTETSAMLWPFVFGILWGLGSMTLGMSFAFIGLSLAYALNYGAQIITGWLVPLFIDDTLKIFSTKGYVILAGVGACIIGVIIAGRAAILKERSMADAEKSEEDSQKPKMGIGVTIGILSGVLCACYGVGASFKNVVGANAVNLYHNAGWQSAWAQMCVIVWGGAISSCLYCMFKLTKNKTWGHLTKPGIGKTFFLALVMASLHDGAIFLFGLAANGAGISKPVHVSIAYPVFMAFAIIVGNFHGFRTGEWKGASSQSKVLIITGVVLLTVGVSFLGAAFTL